MCDYIYSSFSMIHIFFRQIMRNSPEHDIQWVEMTQVMIFLEELTKQNASTYFFQCFSRTCLISANYFLDFYCSTRI